MELSIDQNKCKGKISVDVGASSILLVGDKAAPSEACVMEDYLNSYGNIFHDSS